MKIEVYKKTKHINCPIYIRRMENTFEYLTVINGLIYTQQVEFAPTFLGKFLKFAGTWKDVYTKKQLDSSIFYMTAMAETTIETILGVDEKGNKISKIKVINKKDVDKMEKNNK